MSPTYDICVDYDSLIELQSRLERVLHDLTYSTEQMTNAIRSSREFLSGHQFEKAKETTMICTKMAEKTAGNIRHAMEYLEKLKVILEKYEHCKYIG